MNATGPANCIRVGTCPNYEGITNIAPSAIIGSNVILGENVTVGPFTIIDGNVIIGDDTVIDERVSIKGNTIIGSNNTIFPGVTIGLPPQNLTYDGEPCFTSIGHGNTIREYATIHAGPKGETQGTTVGNNTMLMTHTHVAHNCTIGNGVIMANNAQISGFVLVEDQSVIGGFVGVHQHVRIGALTMVGGYSYCMQDVPPFMMVTANPGRIVGLNTVGLKRAGISAEDIKILKQAHRILFRAVLTRAEAIERIERELSGSEPVRKLLAFMQNSRRGICRSKKTTAS
jgi:UDP-N-acetylglucosamine acyltransferase